MARILQRGIVLNMPVQWHLQRAIAVSNPFFAHMLNILTNKWWDRDLEEGSVVQW